MRIGIAIAIAAGVALAGCEAKIGSGQASNAAAEAGAEGKAEEGKFALKAPGLDVSLAIPKALADGMTASGEDQLIYPGSRIGGLYVASGGEGGRGEAEIRFSTADVPEKVAAWYRDPARAGQFAVRDVLRNTAEIRLEGEEKGGGRSFRLRLIPTEGGGTDARLTLRDRS